MDSIESSRQVRSTHPVLIPRAGSARGAVTRKRDKVAARSLPPAVGVPDHPHPVPRARAEGRTLIRSGAHQVAEKEQRAGRAAAEARGDTAARGDHGCGPGTESRRRGLLLLLLSPPWPPKPRAAPLHGEAARIPAGTGHLVQGPAPARGATFLPAPGRRPAARGATCRCHRTRRRRRHRRSRRRPRSPNRAPAPPRSQSRPLPPSASLPSPPPWSLPPNPRRPPLRAVGAHTGGDRVVPPLGRCSPPGPWGSRPPPSLSPVPSSAPSAPLQSAIPPPPPNPFYSPLSPFPPRPFSLTPSLLHLSLPYL